jgi:hypothetical protein
MKTKETVTRLRVPPLLALLLCLVAVPLILLRLFGVLFFVDTISVWAIVPAVAIIALLALANTSQPIRRGGAVLVFTSYLASVFFHGWPNLMERLAEGGNGLFEGAEAILILILVSLCMAFRGLRE